MNGSEFFRLVWLPTPIELNYLFKPEALIFCTFSHNLQSARESSWDDLRSETTKKLWMKRWRFLLIDQHPPDPWGPLPVHTHTHGDIGYLLISISCNFQRSFTVIMLQSTELLVRYGKGCTNEHRTSNKYISDSDRSSIGSHWNLHVSRVTCGYALLCFDCFISAKLGWVCALPSRHRAESPAFLSLQLRKREEKTKQSK